MNVKNLLIVTDSFLPRWDGVARFLAEVIPKLKHDFNITVIAPDFPGDKEEIKDIKVIRMPLSRWSINNFPIAKKSRKLIRPYVEKADIIWVQGLSALGNTAIKLGKKLEKPLITYIHVFDWEIFTKSISAPGFIKRFLYWIAKVYSRRLYNKCTVLMVPSSDIAYIFEKEKIKVIKTVIPLGINSEKFKPPEDKKQAKEDIGLNPDDKIIGYCGRIGREKNLITLHRAFSSLKKRHKNVKLLIVGKGMESLEKIFKDKSQVIMTGEKDNVVPYLQAMDIYVLPSLTETTSLSTLEAMSTALPVVVTPLPAIKKYVIDKENGLFFPKENWLVLRKKLEQLLEKPHLRFSLGQEARKTVKNRFSWDETVKRIKDVLKRY